ncbi:MAG: polysaccharide export protein [Candidatus Omnitrophica bacterium]|nr:polysaccharide export protein [Candidatus Omnitrophota bacterium]
MQGKFIPILTISLGLLISSFLSSATAEDKPPQTPKPAATLEKIPAGGYALAIPSNIPGYDAKTTPSEFNSVKYTLGPDDVIDVTVMRHPEFSGSFPVNSEGKIQYKFVGDIDVSGLTKKQVEDKLVKVLSSYLVGPEVSVTITEYKSKFVFVLGEVSQPGKFYIKSEIISVRDAVVNAGLPTYSAAMRKCSLITPDKSGRVKNRPVNIYAILYVGDLRRNIDMHPGDVLYVPSTIMAKVIRIISPVATTVGLASSPAENTSTIKTSAKMLAL